MADPGQSMLNSPTTKNRQEDDFTEVDLLVPVENPKSLPINNNQCRNQSIIREDGPIIVDVENGKTCPPVNQPRKKENVSLKYVTVNRGLVHCLTVWYSQNIYKSIMPLLYLLGVPFIWLLLGTLQYLVCIITLGGRLLDPWYFTCAWTVEVICTMHIAVIVMIVCKCLHVRLEVLEYCEKVTWIGFTYLIFQGLAIALLLLPVSNLFKNVFGDFSRPINFFIYWMVFVFPHFVTLYLATFGCCLKMFRSFSRHLYYANSCSKHGGSVQVCFESKDQQVTDTLNHDINIELQELNFHPILRSNKNLQFSL